MISILFSTFHLLLDYQGKKQLLQKLFFFILFWLLLVVSYFKEQFETLFEVLEVSSFIFLKLNE